MSKILTIKSDNPDDFYQVIDLIKSISQNFEIYSPYLESETKKVSRQDKFISYLAAVGGLSGLIIGLLLQYWTSAVDFKINLGGRSFFNWIYTIPVAFEIAVLLSVIFGFLAFLIKTSLPDWKPKENEIKTGITHALNNSYILNLYLEDTKEADKIVHLLNGIKNIEYTLI